MSAPALEWSYSPWRDRPGACAAGLALFLAGCLAVATLGESPLLSGGLCLALAASLSPALLPARCRVDEGGVARHGLLGELRRPWGELRRGVLRPGSLMLSPYPRPHWLDPYRGVLLPIPAGEWNRVAPALRGVLDDHGL